MIPQIIYLVMSLLGLGVIIERHGKPKTGNNNVWMDLLATIIIYSLLYSGGFFDCFFDKPEPKVEAVSVSNEQIRSLVDENTVLWTYLYTTAQRSVVDSLETACKIFPESEVEE